MNAKATSVLISNPELNKTKVKGKNEDDKLAKEAEAKKVADLEGLNLEEALKRRSDWTPPKASAVISLDEDITAGNSALKASFGDALRDYHYSRENSVSELMPLRKEGNPTKRRRLEVCIISIFVLQVSLTNINSSLSLTFCKSENP